MKHLLTYESLKSVFLKNYNWIEIDDNFAIKITSGKINICLRESKYNNWSRYLLASGIAKILDTEYIKNEEIRNIEIVYGPNAIIQEQTNKSMVRSFILQEFPDYEHITYYSNFLGRLNRFIVWEDECKTIGEYIDKVIEYKNKIIGIMKPIYDKWKIGQDAKKFGL